ncbi:MAG TPA: sigma 54-interacting transcriptional regulator [Candidatus Binatia bacterium]|nr:sigma 54-interacting transcriptional regulator [Candidatus Binatia bacterium]
MRILIVDDGPRGDLLAVAAARACPGAAVSRAPSVEPARVEEAAPRLVVLGPGVADRPHVAEIVRALAARQPDVPILVASEQDHAAAAVAVVKAGAADYVVVRDGGAALCAAVAALLGARAPTPPSRAAAAGDGLAGLVGVSRAIEQVRALVRTAARTEAHVLIEGETGTGKELVARAIHGLGRRAAGPFVPLNCAAIPETLAESEFFGHARGAFTGALQERPGALRLADRGTLFLDEVEDLPLALQAKLLRVVQDREVRPLGGSAARRVDVRIVAAANRDLGRMVEAGEFRRDLYYRLRVLAIALPPLRQRREDVPALVAHFVGRYNRRHATAFTVPPANALRPFLEHAWPGNVRELENTLESLLTLASASGGDLAQALRERPALGAGLWADERTRILRVLEEHRWNRQRSAAALGISRVTLWRRMERHGIRDPLGAPARETA